MRAKSRSNPAAPEACAGRSCSDCDLGQYLLAPGADADQAEATTADEHCGHCTPQVERSGLVEETITTVLTTVDMGEVLDRITTLMRRHFGETRVGVTRLLDHDQDQVEVLLVDDPRHPPVEPGTRLALAGTARGRAVSTGQLQVLEGLDSDQPRVQEERELSQLGYGSLAVFPLNVDGRVLGTLELAHPHEHQPLDRCLGAAGRVAQLIAIALHNSLLMAEVQRLNRLLDRENAYLKDQIRHVRRGARYVAEGPAMRDVLDKVRRVAPSDSTVLVRGETGTGKEGLARMIHELSSRATGPFVVVNLGAIPETLLESELFGHEKGAFTGAVRRRIGRFEQASGGTIFLDEVGDAPLPVQVKMLRALQERCVERVGGGASIQVDVRVVAATNRPLERLIEEGTFRADFFYRLATFPIQLPPLRERPHDLRPLVEHLLKRHAARMNRRPPAVQPGAWEILAAHGWPGNIRELENYLERALIMSSGDRLILPELPGSAALPTPRAAQPDAPLLSFNNAVRELLQRSLASSGGKVYGADGAAAKLGLKPTTLQGKLRKYGLK